MGMSGGRARQVTPPIIIPVSSEVSSDFAKEARLMPMSSQTLWFTSRRLSARTTDAECFLAPRLLATTMVLPEVSMGKAVLFAEIDGVGEIGVNLDDFVMNADIVQECCHAGFDFSALVGQFSPRLVSDVLGGSNI